MRIVGKTRQLSKLILILLIFVWITACGDTEPDNTKNNDLYRRVACLCHSLNEDGFGRDIITVTEGKEWIYKRGDIEVDISSDEQENSITYLFKVNDETVLNYKKEGVDYPQDIFVYYADINQDGCKDIILEGAAPRGTLAGPHWIYIYDLNNDCELRIFEEEGSLTDELITGIDHLLDSRFHKLFPEVNLTDCKYVGELFVDHYGNMYYITSLSEGDTIEKIHGVGEMIIFISYDAENELFFVENVLYMPFSETAND